MHQNFDASLTFFQSDKLNPLNLARWSSRFFFSSLRCRLQRTYHPHPILSSLHTYLCVLCHLQLHFTPFVWRVLWHVRESVVVVIPVFCDSIAWLSVVVAVVIVVMFFLYDVITGTLGCSRAVLSLSALRQTATPTFPPT